MKVKILKSGLQTTLQDKGRIGYQKFGIPVSGALDIASFYEANTLVNNDLNNPCLEITLMGPRLELSDNCVIAITGGDLSPQKNGLPIPMHESVSCAASDILSFGRPKSGCRSYMAIGGNWKVKEWLGSISPLLYLGDIRQAGLLQKGDEIEIEPHDRNIYTKLSKKSSYTSKALVMYKGPEYDEFSQSSITKFLSQEYIITNNSNRMGYRLDGDPLTISYIPEMISSGTLPGTIQIINEGLPIILMNDAQTTGGYPRIGILTQKSINQLAQKRPGEIIKFTL